MTTRPSLFQRLRRVIRKVLSLDDTPHNIALGVAIGTFVAYQPIVGIQMIVGALVCKIFRANIPASLPMAWITNPFTIAPIFFGTYRLGCVFTGGLKTYDDIKGVFEQIANLGFWRGILEGYRFLMDIMWPMVVGGAIVGVINGVIFYYIVRRLVIRHRMHRDEALKEAIHEEMNHA